MLRTFLFSILLGALSLNFTAQSNVNWSFSYEKIEGEKDTYYLVFHADIGKRWHMYAVHLPDENAGPLPTTFTFTENNNIEIIGEIEEENDKVHTEMDEAFGVEVSYFEGKVVFKQKVKLKTNSTTVKGFVSFMVCDNSMCLPPEDVEFSIEVK